MNTFFKKSFFVLLVAALLIPQLTFAVSPFNPDYIISDEQLTDYKSMSKSDIQLFLREKNSALAKLKAPDVNGKKRTVADMIYRAAQEHKINPKYILVKLQKEQSLITAKKPTQKQLDWAAGYAVCDSCSMDDPKIQKNKGFGNQVDSAAGIMRWYYDNVGKQGFIKKKDTTYTISGESVTPKTMATAFLYTYTPHRQGNENFWKLWQSWFGQTYPDGTLLKSADSPGVYVLSGGKKRLISSMSVLHSRYNTANIVTVPASEIARYEEGSPITFPNYSILLVDDTYYLVDFETVRPFASAEVVRKLGYNPDEILEATEADIEGYELGSVIDGSEKYTQGRLVRVKNPDALILIKGDSFYTVPDPKVALAAYPKLKENIGSRAELSGLTDAGNLLLPNGSLMRVVSSTRIFVIDDGKKRQIKSEELFTALGYNKKNIIVVNEAAGLAHKTGAPISVDSVGASSIAAVPAPKPTSVPKPAAPTTPIDTVASVKEDVDLATTSFSYTEGTMVTTPAKQTKYIGTQFDTKIDSYIVADYDSLDILAGKNIDTLRPLASLVKPLTAYYLLEDGLSLTKKTAYNAAKHRVLYNYFRIAPGEVVKNSDLMDSFLVSSLNRAGRMLVQNISEDSVFLKSMTKRLHAAGFDTFSLVGVSGEEVENIATPREYVSAFKMAIENDTVSDYLRKLEYSYDEVLDLDGKPTHFDTNTNKLAGKTDLGFTILESKTGYLDEAGSNLIMVVQRPKDKKKFIILTMGNPDYINRFVDPQRLAQWALKNF